MDLEIVFIISFNENEFKMHKINKMNEKEILLKIKHITKIFTIPIGKINYIKSLYSWFFIFDTSLIQI